MALVTKTPGVYIQEIPGFANTVVEVETAVPAFIGYTEKALQGSRSLKNVPLRISGMTDFVKYFGKPPPTRFNFAGTPVFDVSAVVPNASSFVFAEPGAQPEANAMDTGYQRHNRYYLYYAIQMFFNEGGGSCFVVSVGDYNTAIKIPDLKGGLDALIAEPVSTMVVAPDAMSLPRQDANSLAVQILSHCEKMQSRVAILDVFAGDMPINVEANPIDQFRNGVQMDRMEYGAAYYPWLETSIVDDSQIDLSFLTEDAQATVMKELSDYTKSEPDAKRKTILGIYVGRLLPSPAPAVVAALAAPAATGGPAAAGLPAATPPPAPPPQGPLPSAAQSHQALLVSIPFYRPLMSALLDEVNCLPPSGAIAGIYALTDFNRGVFKAPAGVGVKSAVKPIVSVTFDDQQDLNMPLDGKAINAIRAIPGSGVMVWGARTLNGNSDDWRYINVRRTAIMLEQSIKNAAQAYMFEPNTATTWVSVESTIANFLTSQWKAGALFGATPALAFTVSVGLGLTMTSEDILNGFMNVMVKLAIVRPAEFIVLTFQQTMPNG